MIPYIRIWPFVPLDQLLCHTALVACHGGQMTIFESLQQSVPVLVMPFQPEQAHNGVCLERIGCGRRLVPAVAFEGCADVYREALNHLSPGWIHAAITALTDDPQTPQRLATVANTLRRLSGAPLLAQMMEHN
jgi:UDP-N-acetylglucosamine:LPS N-acetylglucosamine transferase